jgi:hypothetical protein
MQRGTGQIKETKETTGGVKSKLQKNKRENQIRNSRITEVHARKDTPPPLPLQRKRTEQRLAVIEGPQQMLALCVCQ